MTTFRHTKTGRVVESTSNLGYPWVDIAAPTTEFGARTADAILADVGDDAILARAALEAEQERETPRKVLTARLQRIIDDADES